MPLISKQCKIMVSIHKTQQEALNCIASLERLNSGELRYNDNKQGETRTTHMHVGLREINVVTNFLWRASDLALAYRSKRSATMLAKAKRSQAINQERQRGRQSVWTPKFVGRRCQKDTPLQRHQDGT